MGHPFDFDVAEAFVLRAEKRSELPPLFWNSFVLLHVGVDTLTCLAQVSPLSLLGFFDFWEEWWLGCDMWNGGGKVLGTLVCLAGSASLEISGHSGREPGTSGGLTSSLRRMASSSGVGQVPHSSSVGFKGTPQ